MATGAMVSAAFSVVLKALAPLTNHLLKQWAASVKLGKNVSALELELLSVKALLEHALGREIDNSGLKELLLMLQELGYDAEDLLDELDYFRIQDGLEGESEAVDRHAKGCVHNLALNLRHTAKAVGKHFPCSCPPSVRDDDSMHNNQPPQLRFNRVNASKRMQHIVEKLQHVRAHVSTTIATIGSSWSAAQNIAESRPITTSESIELKLYGRERNDIMNSIIHDITRGNHSGSKAITVIPIVGPGGIGKTTLAQHIYHDKKVQDHFDVKIWTCVSLNFNANKLIENIERDKFGASGQGSSTAGELIRQELKYTRFLLVLDDVWDCSNEDEWKRLLLPFERSEVQGNVILVTTRFPAQAQMVKTIDQSIYLKGLDHKEFNELFQEIVFGSDQCRKDHNFLMETGNKIVARLKGSPLAAKTVGRLLKSQLDLVHWTRVLESREWEQKDGKNDIMPALKLSYDYLPLHLKQCFPYCALFPQDYRFKREELINFWIGMDVLHSSCGENRRVEDIGLSHLTELVNHGFFEKEGKEDGNACYVIHDLLHELALKVSSHECLSIDSSQPQLSSLRIMPSIRHLSINIDDSVDDRFIRKNCVEDFSKLGTSGLKVEKLRTLILFGKHQGLLVKAFGDLFREAKALRVIILSEATYAVENLLQNFYNLIHLRYLQIQSSLVRQPRFPNKISRFYHMMILDAKLCDGITDLPRHMSNLVKLRHFLVSNDETHSSIFEVGKLKSLQELRIFVVKKESQGFDLSQIGHLVELGGSICISNLENVRVKEEADEAKLMQKSRLHELILSWEIGRSNIDSTLEDHVLERLKPSSSLLKLSIEGHRGSTCPSWLGINLSVKSLESLCLKGVAWKTFPPIGLLWLVNESFEEILSNIPDKSFENLRRLELVKLPLLKRWAVHAPCQLFPFLEVLVIKNCPELEELSFSHSACCQQGRGAYANLFPKLSGLEIESCPRLLSFPPVPWTEAPCSTVIGRGTSTSSSYFRNLSFSGYNLIIWGKDTGSLEIESEDTRSSTFWNVLAFHNLSKLKVLDMNNCQPLPLHYLEMLISLRTLKVSCASNAFPFVEGDSHVEYQFPVESVHIERWNASGKELTRLLTYFPKLSCLELSYCEKITELDVMGQRATTTYGPSSSADKADEAQIEKHQQQDAREEKDEIVALAAEEFLILPPQLEKLEIAACPELILRYNPLDNNKEDGRRTGKGVGLQGLNSLQQLRITNCPKLFSSYSSSSFSSCFPFPDSLQHLSLDTEVVGMEETPMPLSNLLSLRSLSIIWCGDLRGEGLFPLLAHGHLTSLDVTRSPNFFVGSKPPLVHEQELPSRSSKLENLIIEDVTGFTATPICSLLFDALTTLEILDEEVEHFTKEQEALLFVNSLEVITFFGCRNLQCLPPGLHALPNLKRLNMWLCDGIHMLPEDGLPSSLKELSISGCESIQSLTQNSLPSSLQMLVIENCPAIQSLPQVEDLPTSLQKLYVRCEVSEELRRQCRELIGTIPTVELEEPMPCFPCGSALNTLDSE